MTFASTHTLAGTFILVVKSIQIVLATVTALLILIDREDQSCRASRIIIDNNNCQVVVLATAQIHTKAVSNCPIAAGSNLDPIEIGCENVISCDFEGGNS